MQKNQNMDNNQSVQAVEQPIQNRRLCIIETSIRKQKLYYDTIRGDRTQTKQMNIHAKTINQKHLKRCIIANQIEGNDKNVIQQYRKMNANFQSSQFLFKSLQHRTKVICKNYVQSSDIVKDILRSDRMFMNNKIIFLKYMKKVESGIDTPNVSWKQQYFKNKCKNRRDKEKKQETRTAQVLVQAMENIKQQQNIRKLAGNFGQGNISITSIQQSKNMRNIHTYGPAIFTASIICPINQTEGIILNQFK